MNNIEKIQLINQVFIDYEFNGCPYCNQTLTSYVDKDGKEKKYCDQHEGDIFIQLIDYFDVIKGIIKYSELMNSPIKFKKLSEF